MISNIDLQSSKSILEIIALLLTIIGFPAIYLTLYFGKRKDRQDKEYTIYNSLDDKYTEFVKLNLEYKDIRVLPEYFCKLLTENSISNTDIIDPPNSNQVVAFGILTSLFERAFVLYSEQGSRMNFNQWKGWDRYMKHWATDKQFVSIWKIDGEYWETEFETYMNNIIRDSNFVYIPKTRWERLKEKFF